MVKRISFIVTFSAVLLFMSVTPLWAASKSVAVNVSVEVAPLFEISVSGPDNGDIAFGRIEKDPNRSISLESRETIITATSNLGTPYQITQALVSPLSNENGESFGAGAMKAFARGQKEQSRGSDGLGVSTNSSTLYVSNPSGSSDTITAHYALDVAPTQSAGMYNTRLVYTIVAM